MLGGCCGAGEAGELRKAVGWVFEGGGCFAVSGEFEFGLFCVLGGFGDVDGAAFFFDDAKEFEGGGFAVADGSEHADGAGGGFHPTFSDGHLSLGDVHLPAVGENPAAPFVRRISVCDRYDMFESGLPGSI